MVSKKIFVSTILVAFCLAIACLSPERICAEEKTVVKDNLRIPDSSHVQILTTTDGSTNIGRIVEVGEDEIQFETELGTVTVVISKIREIKEIPASLIRDGTYWFPNPNATRLYFGPTGRTLKKEEGYFADYYLFFPMVAYGVTDNVTIAGGMSLFPWIGFDKQIFYFTPKVGLISRDGFALSLGALVATLPFWNEDVPTVGILYGVGSFGGPDGSMTAGLGYGFVDWDFADKPMLMFGGEQRASRSVSLVTENWILPGADKPLISYGIRFFGEALSVDLAFINVVGEGMTFPGIPYIDFVHTF